MDKIILDPTLREKLNGLDRELELCDETGRTLGHYLPEAAYRKLVLASLQVRLTEEEIEQRRQQRGTGRSLAEIPFTEEEIERRRQETGGCSLADLWKRLGRT
jgi:hypothetical protein